MLHFNYIVNDYADFKKKYYDHEGRKRFRTELACMIWTAKYYKREWKISQTDILSIVMLIMNNYCKGDQRAELRIATVCVICNDTYSTDQMFGVRVDGKPGLRLIKKDDGRVYGVKYGKAMNAFNDCLPYPAPEKVIIMATEQLAAYFNANMCTEAYELHIDRNFGDIYNGNKCAGDFGSCMTNDGQWTFYRDAVKASACYLTDEDGMIVARAIRFDEVTDDDTGEKLRLLERQYSLDKRNDLKQILVDKLLAAGEIDGYKEVGASYNENRRFKSKKGEDWSHRNFSIGCNLKIGDTISFQDSFYGFSKSEQTACNYSERDYNLATCDSCYGDEEIEYYEWYCNEYHRSYASRSWLEEYCEYIDGDYYDAWTIINGYCYRLDDENIVKVNGTYYLEEDCVYCERYGRWLLMENATYINYGDREDEYVMDGDSIYFEDDECDISDDDSHLRYNNDLECYVYYEYRKVLIQEHFDDDELEAAGFRRNNDSGTIQVIEEERQTA